MSTKKKALLTIGLAVLIGIGVFIVVFVGIKCLPPILAPKQCSASILGWFNTLTYFLPRWFLVGCFLFVLLINILFVVIMIKIWRKR